MQIRFNNGSGRFEVQPSRDEKLTVAGSPFYNERLIVFKQAEDIEQEIHVNFHTGEIVSREMRKAAFPCYEYDFSEEKIRVICTHAFMDEVNYGSSKPRGIDTEIIVEEIVSYSGESLSKTFHTHPANKPPFFDRQGAERSVQFYLQRKKAEREQQEFLLNKYSKWSCEEKANYWYGTINFHERQQGGYPIPYKKFVLFYLTKEFAEKYRPYDKDVKRTMQLIAESYGIDTSLAERLVKYDRKDHEWEKIVHEAGLMEQD